jgi:hypothetical protein
MAGFFDLKTRMDLLHKLEREYAKLEQDDEDIDAAYNFFATAENMPEWIKGGGRKGKRFKHTIQQQELLLTLVNELATGAKHFTSDKLKPAVRSMTRGGWIDSDWIESGWVEMPLIVHLSPEQATQLGQEEMHVRDLAGRVLAFWQAYLGSAQPP